MPQVWKMKTQPINTLCLLLLMPIEIVQEFVNYLFYFEVHNLRLTCKSMCGCIGKRSLNQVLREMIVLVANIACVARIYDPTAGPFVTYFLHSWSIMDVKSNDIEGRIGYFMFKGDWKNVIIRMRDTFVRIQAVDEAKALEIGRVKYVGTNLSKNVNVGSVKYDISFRFNCVKLQGWWKDHLIVSTYHHATLPQLWEGARFMKTFVQHAMSDKGFEVYHYSRQFMGKCVSCFSDGCRNDYCSRYLCHTPLSLMSMAWWGRPDIFIDTTHCIAAQTLIQVFKGSTPQESFDNVCYVLHSLSNQAFPCFMKDDIEHNLKYGCDGWSFSFMVHFTITGAWFTPVEKDPDPKTWIRLGKANIYALGIPGIRNVLKNRADKAEFFFLTNKN